MILTICMNMSFPFPYSNVLFRTTPHGRHRAQNLSILIFIYKSVRGDDSAGSVISATSQFGVDMSYNQRMIFDIGPSSRSRARTSAMRPRSPKEADTGRPQVKSADRSAVGERTLPSATPMRE